MEDRLPNAEVVHDAAPPYDDPFAAALSLTRREGRWSQHLFSGLGRRRGGLVEVHVVRSWDPAQDSGPKGYLTDDELVWRTEAVCFPAPADLARPFSVVGATIVAEGRYGLDLPVDGLAWVVEEAAPGPPRMLAARAYLLPWSQLTPPDIHLRFTIAPDTSGAPADLTDRWEEHRDDAGPEASLRRWRRRTADHLIQVELEGRDGPGALAGLADRLLGGFWLLR